MVLGYFESGTADDVPDESIWHHPERLEEWWEAVKQRREKGWEDVPAAVDEEDGMTGNALVNDLIGE